MRCTYFIVLVGTICLAACVVPEPPVTPENAPPRVRLAVRLQIKVGQPLALDARESFDPDGTVVEYRYVFGNGDGELNTGKGLAEHTFSRTGRFGILLTIVDDDGAWDRTHHDIDVLQSDPPACGALNPCPAAAECREADQQCWVVRVADACAQDSDCPRSEQVCLDARCVTPACVEDADCEGDPGQVCRGFVCVGAGSVDGGA